jgi:cytochrome c oxidase subunit 2
MCEPGCKKRTVAAACATALAAGGCGGVQSALDPRGPAAHTLAELTWLMFFGATAIFLLVIALAAYAVYREPGKRRPVSSTAMIVAGGIVLPAIVLSALLVHGVGITGALRLGERREALEIRVTAHQFWWEVLYPGARPGEFVATANEIRLPAGREVAVRLTSGDVIHSFWVPNLAGKIDVIPGRITRLVLQADRPGALRGQCAEFCGASHAHMALEVVALAQEDFDRWLARLRAPASTPDGAAVITGREAFVAQGCANCHAVRNLAPPQLIAPDLTHLASRAFLGAGALPNTREDRIAWLVDGERVKPGRAMPSYGHLDPATLAALADYLGSLE